MTEELFLNISGSGDAKGGIISGWQSIRVTRGVERMPSDFDIEVTERFPGQAKDVVITPGDICRVKLGNDLVMTGYVDRYLPSITSRSHTIRVMGRSACCDLVDCSIITPTNQIAGATVRGIAEQLAALYGITVDARSGDGPVVPQIIVNLGETPYQVIERVARYAAFLSYDDPMGRLVLSQVGVDKMSGGLIEGQNVVAAAVTFTIDERYSEYHPFFQSVNSFMQGELPANGNALPVVIDSGMGNLKRIDGQPRVRKHAIISEQVYPGENFAEVRAKWEMARRYGRSQAIRVTTDSWRDGAGALWQPNARVKVNVPSCKVENREGVIAEVTYFRDGHRGTGAELMIMPPEAFTPEPTIISPFDAQIVRELNPSAGVPVGQSPAETPSTRDGPGV